MARRKKPTLTDLRRVTDNEWNAFAAAHSLSPRELQVLVFTCQDVKRDAIAARLDISPNTVDTYIRRLDAKLQLKHRMKLFQKVMEFVLERRQSQ